MYSGISLEFCILQFTNVVKHVSMCIFAFCICVCVCMCECVKTIQILYSCFIGLFAFVLGFASPLYSLDTNALPDLSSSL